MLMFTGVLLSSPFHLEITLQLTCASIRQHARLNGLKLVIKHPRLNPRANAGEARISRIMATKNHIFDTSGE
jgi:hypothetical protein